MSDEFDDDAGDAWAAHAAAAMRRRKPAHAARRSTAARLVARLYDSADRSLRAKALTCLLRPLGPLGLVAVASGSFASFLARAAAPSTPVMVEDAAGFTRDQVFELVRFAEQVNPDVLRQLADLFSDSPLGGAGASAVALTLLLRTFQRSAEPAGARLVAIRAGLRPGNGSRRGERPGC